MGRRVRAYVGLGSNIGEPAVNLARAIQALGSLPGVRIRAVSQLYATTPVGVLDQPDFRNAVVALDVPIGSGPDAGALDLLADLKAIERQLGRRPRRRWGPREVDLDLLLFGRHRIRVERPADLAGTSAPGAEASHPSVVDSGPLQPKLLEVPHRDVRERLFVLAPLGELAPRLVPPGWHETIATARRRREGIEGAGAARPVGAWDVAAGQWSAYGGPAAKREGLAGGGR